MSSRRSYLTHHPRPSGVASGRRRRCLRQWMVPNMTARSPNRYYTDNSTSSRRSSSSSSRNSTNNNSTTSTISSHHTPSTTRSLLPATPLRPSHARYRRASTITWRCCAQSDLSTLRNRSAEKAASHHMCSTANAVRIRRMMVTTTIIRGGGHEARAPSMTTLTRVTRWTTADDRRHDQVQRQKGARKPVPDDGSRATRCCPASGGRSGRFHAFSATSCTCSSPASCCSPQCC